MKTPTLFGPMKIPTSHLIQFKDQKMPNFKLIELGQENADCKEMLIKKTRTFQLSSSAEKNCQLLLWLMK
jgi:hypothetical protein